MSLPALPVTADTRSITERVNVLIRDYNNPPATQRFVPSGVVLPFAGGAAPAGFLLCFGQAVSRATYADLFAAIGTTYGAGDGSTTFNVPDLRGRVAAGKDDMGGGGAGRITGSGQAGINGTTLGAAGGAQDNTLDTTRIPAHSHGYSDPGHAHSFLQGDSTPASFTSRAGEGDGNNNYFTSTTGSGVGITISNAGGGGAHNNTQPTIILNHIIST
jgi:microcystin-dependent protein